MLMRRILYFLLFLFFVGGFCVYSYKEISTFPRHECLKGHQGLFLWYLLNVVFHFLCSLVTWRWFVRSKDREFKFWKS